MLSEVRDETTEEPQILCSVFLAAEITIENHLMVLSDIAPVVTLVGMRFRNDT